MAVNTKMQSLGWDLIAVTPTRFMTTTTLPTVADDFAYYYQNRNDPKDHIIISWSVSKGATVARWHEDQPSSLKSKGPYEDIFDGFNIMYALAANHTQKKHIRTKRVGPNKGMTYEAGSKKIAGIETPTVLDAGVGFIALEPASNNVTWNLVVGRLFPYSGRKGIIEHYNMGISRGEVEKYLPKIIYNMKHKPNSVKGILFRPSIYPINETSTIEYFPQLNQDLKQFINKYGHEGILAEPLKHLTLRNSLQGWLVFSFDELQAPELISEKTKNRPVFSKQLPVMVDKHLTLGRTKKVEVLPSITSNITKLPLADQQGAIPLGVTPLQGIGLNKSQKIPFRRRMLR